jgi:sec-independent protein translocase protein TatC
MTLSPDTLRPEKNEGGPQMSFWEHVDELRRRILRVLFLLIFCLVASSVFVQPLMEYLIVPCECELVLLRPTDGIIMYFRVALMSAAIICVPYATYQLLMFVVPGLTRQERRAVFGALPITVLLFLAGVAFAWFILVPTAIPFLRDFMGSVFRAEWTANEYIAFLTALMFWMGIAFEMPVLCYVLGRVGLLTAGVMIRNWRLAVVLMTIAAAAITPTVDPFNMMLVTLPLLGLYVVSIVLVALANRLHRRGLEAPLP